MFSGVLLKLLKAIVHFLKRLSVTYMDTETFTSTLIGVMMMMMMMIRTAAGRGGGVESRRNAAWAGGNM
eukprot:6849621-Karenia_brevis.AAC.1